MEEGWVIQIEHQMKMKNAIVLIDWSYIRKGYDIYTYWVFGGNCGGRTVSVPLFGGSGGGRATDRQTVGEWDSLVADAMDSEWTYPLVLNDSSRAVGDKVDIDTTLEGGGGKQSGKTKATGEEPAMNQQCDRQHIPLRLPDCGVRGERGDGQSNDGDEIGGGGIRRGVRITRGDVPGRELVDWRLLRGYNGGGSVVDTAITVHTYCAFTHPQHGYVFVPILFLWTIVVSRRLSSISYKCSIDGW